MRSSKDTDSRPERDLPDDKYEQYEDALFALLMDRAAEAEGKRLLEENERLMQDPAAAVPEEIHQRCLDAIDHAFRRREREERRARRRAAAWKALIRVGGVAAALALTITLACAAFSDFRAGVWNLLVEVHEKFTSLRIGTGDEPEELRPTAENPVLFGDGKFAITWLPEGYHVIDKNTTDTSATIFIGGQSDEDIITVRASFIKEPQITIDTEDADSVSDIQISGHSGLIVVKGSRIQIAWVDSTNFQHYSLITFQCSEKDAISLATGITYVG